MASRHKHMARRTVTRGTVGIRCMCGGTVEFEQELLGRVFRCPHCGRYLRPALQFLLVDREIAPNLTAQCTCGHFIVEDPSRAGKRIRCKACRMHLLMPHPVVSVGVEPVARVSRKVLRDRMRRSDMERQRVPAEMERLQHATHAGRVSLRPGESICVNPGCGALLSLRANVCSKCGTNRITGRRYTGPGPAGDPTGRWQQV
jgi:hypothetical protein